MPELDVEVITQHDPRLGRQKVHDPRSLEFPALVSVYRSTWRDKRVRIYDPTPNPNQDIGCCTACAKAMQLNALGNSNPGVLDYNWARNTCYPLNTRLDPFPGQWEPDDTGSSSLASCKAAQQLVGAGAYRWAFGADQVVQLVMNGWVVSVGTWWYYDMFYPDSDGRVSPSGGQAGGHQYAIRGYDQSRDWVLGRCWWGEFKDFWITRADLDSLLRDGGDAHIQKVKP